MAGAGPLRLDSFVSRHQSRILGQCLCTLSLRRRVFRQDPVVLSPQRGVFSFNPVVLSLQRGPLGFVSFRSRAAEAHFIGNHSQERETEYNSYLSPYSAVEPVVVFLVSHRILAPVRETLSHAEPVPN